MAKFILMKSTRSTRTGTRLSAYRVPSTCRKAGVTPGKVYNSRKQAEADARKLGAVNPVGFDVVPLDENSRARNNPRKGTPCHECGKTFRTESGHTWHMKNSKQWLWQNATTEWQLSQGEHMVVLDYREPVFLDQVELIRLSNFRPTNSKTKPKQ